MTALWLDTEGMSHYHHMVRHEIYLLYVNNLYLKQLNTKHSLLNGWHYVELSISLCVTSIKNGAIVCP